ncbi:MAG: hypothetical protein PGN30_11070 [Mycolicibacterium neoaurum]|uniref:hypothetical protein n=1 Tax=Mycolicibacterium neoaurum TaxID=1795 RepID=UPI002FF764CA
MKLWQCNLIGTAVAAAAAITATVFILEPEWTDYRRTVVPAHIAAPRQSIEVDGQTWAVRNVSRTTTKYGSALPEGTVQLNVLIERTGSAAEEFGCTGYLIEGERSWRGSGPPCGAEMSLPWTFLVPSSAEPTAVDVRRPDGSILLRLEL